MLGHDPEQVGEHAHIRGDPSPDVTGHKPSERRGVAPVDSKEQPMQGGSQPGVDPSDGAEVEQTELPGREQQHVARMPVGVEDALDHHLAQQRVEQGAGERLAIADLLGGPGSC
jgi:hypothetical protein